MIVLGQVAAPYGLRGWIHIRTFGDDPMAWRRMPQWWLGTDADWRSFTLGGMKRHGEGFVVRFEGIEDRASAQSLCGLLFGAPREALPRDGGNEYYWADLIGLEVANPDGEFLGRVAGLIETGANAVLRVEAPGGGEILIPFIETVIRRVDLSAGRIAADWRADW